MMKAIFPALVVVALAACSGSQGESEPTVEQLQQAADDGQAERDATAEKIRNSKPLDLKPVGAGEQKPAAGQTAEGDKPKP